MTRPSALIPAESMLTVEDVGKAVNPVLTVSRNACCRPWSSTALPRAI